MSVATKRQSPVCEQRAILGPGGNRDVRVSEKSESLKKKTTPQRTAATATRKAVSEVPQSVVRSNVSVDSSYSSDSSSSGSLAKSASSKKSTSTPMSKRKGLKPVKAVHDGVEVSPIASKILGPPKRCDWITSNSDPLYVTFHDEEWGVPVHEDKKLFELLVFSQALAELSWPEILSNRDIFRKFFDNFDPSSVAQFTEKKLMSLKVNGNLVLSEPKLRSIVDNAKQILEIQQELGSFSNYCWAFTNKKPIRNGLRYARLVPVKSPKAEVISKNMMARGFRSVGPTVIYSFMQASGIVNDHLTSCFRYNLCCNEAIDAEKSREQEQKLCEALLDKASISSSSSDTDCVH